MHSGIIVLNKPAGIRSTYCVNRVKKILGKKIKVGHAGTLDAPAQGVLLVVVGAATRLSQYLMELPKEYEVRIVLGQETDTDDYTGTVLSTNTQYSASLKKIEEILPLFQGVRMQTPPRVSAVKVSGKRAHKMSRAGIDFAIKPRPVNVSLISKPYYDPHTSELILQIHCHKGTYIRSIARDIGKTLGCGAYVSELKRTRIGPFLINDLRSLNEIQDLHLDSITNNIQPINSFLEEYTTYDVPDSLVMSVHNGNAVCLEDLKRSRWGNIPSAFSVALHGKGFISLARIFIQDDKAYVKPKTNIFFQEKNHDSCFRFF